MANSMCLVGSTLYWSIYFKNNSYQMVRPNKWPVLFEINYLALISFSDIVFPLSAKQI